MAQNKSSLTVVILIPNFVKMHPIEEKSHQADRQAEGNRCCSIILWMYKSKGISTCETQKKAKMH